MPATCPSRLVFALAITLGACRYAVAQTPPPAPPPRWDAQIGASFVGTSGNSETSATGVDFTMHRRGTTWQTEAFANLVETSDHGVDTAERQLAGGRIQRSVTPIVSLTAGERAEHDPLAGIDYRNLLDGGLAWKLVTIPWWTLTGVTAIDWIHEQLKIGPNHDDSGGVFELRSRIPIGASGETTQRITYYPDFSNPSNYRTEGEVALQASMNRWLAVKLGYLVRYANDPIPGFLTTDNTATASVVLQWKASTPAPGK